VDGKKEKNVYLEIHCMLHQKKKKVTNWQKRDVLCVIIEFALNDDEREHKKIT